MVTVPRDDLAGGSTFVSSAKAKAAEVLRSAGEKLAPLKIKLGELVYLPDDPEQLKKRSFIELDICVSERLVTTSQNIRATLPKTPDKVWDKESRKLVWPKMTPLQQEGIDAREEQNQKYGTHHLLTKEFDKIIKDAASELGEFLKKEAATFTTVREVALEIAKYPDSYEIGMELVLVLDNRFSLKEAFELYGSIVSEDQEEVHYAERTLQISHQ